MSTLKVQPVLKESWALYKKFWKPFLGFVGINLLLGVINGLMSADSVIISFLLSIVFTVASIIVNSALMKFSIDVADHKHPTIAGSIKAIKWSIFWRMIVGGIMVGIITLASILLFVIPFLFIFPRIVLVTSYIVEGKGIRASFKESWAVTKDQRTFVWSVLVNGLGVAILGVLCLIVGIIPAMGVIAIMRGMMYIRLKNHKQHEQVVHSIQQN
ncbi:MAG TPA: hypothetical protein VGE63_00125 [Candidatus Paceibacterota bacterium]